MRVFINYGNYGKVLCRFKLPLRRAGASLTGVGVAGSFNALFKSSIARVDE